MTSCAGIALDASLGPSSSSPNPSSTPSLPIVKQSLVKTTFIALMRPGLMGMSEKTQSRLLEKLVSKHPRVIEGFPTEGEYKLVYNLSNLIQEYETKKSDQDKPTE